MKIDIATMSGMLVGIAVVGLAVLSGSDFRIFLNVEGLLIVVGGTFAATLVKFPLYGVFVAMPLGLKAAFTNEKDDPRRHIDQAVKLSRKARTEGLHTIEQNKITNPFFKKGVQMVADGRELDYIRKMMTRDMARSIAVNETSSRVFLAIGEAAPAFGMFGTLVGLVKMLSEMDDPTKIGSAMAVALLTTLYGVLLANLVALPIADKLESKSRYERDLRSLIVECVFQIHARTNPTEMMEVLETFLPEKQRRIGAPKSYTDGKPKPARK